MRKHIIAVALLVGVGLLLYGLAWDARVHAAGGNDSVTHAAGSTKAADMKPRWPEHLKPSEAYPSLLNGLLGFPYNRRNLEEFWSDGTKYRDARMLGVTFGGGGVRREDGTWDDTKTEIRLVTLDNEWLNIIVSGTPLALHDLKREIWARTGKYKFWEAVILLPKTPREGERYYDVDDLDIIGRFTIYWSGPSTVDHYEYEKYRR